LGRQAGGDGLVVCGVDTEGGEKRSTVLVMNNPELAVVTFVEMVVILIPTAYPQMQWE